MIEKQKSVASMFKPYEEISSYEAKQKAPDQSIHNAIVDLGVQFNNNKIIGANARCIALLDAMKKLINDFETPQSQVMSRTLEKHIDKNITFLKKFKSFNEGMDSAVKFVMLLLTYLPPDISDKKAAAWMSEKIDEFIDQKIIRADEEIMALGEELIKADDVIMTYARSSLIEKLLIESYTPKKNFSIIVVDNPPYNEGKAVVEKLANNDIKATYTLLNGAPYFMKRVTKVFVGCSTMLSNGSAFARAGTAMLACISKNYSIPFYVFCESYKFSENTMLDSLAGNEADNPKMLVKKDVPRGVVPLNLRYDLTPKDNINMIVTELGPMPPTSVPVIIREFKKTNYLGKIVGPKADK